MDKDNLIKSQLLEPDQLEQFRPIDFIARQVVEGFITGLHKSPFHGFSVEFAEHRLYNTGESVKHVDWKLYGRTDRLYVKKYEEETNLRCQIVIDNSSSMYFPLTKNPGLKNPNKMVFSVYAAAALILLLKKQRDAFGLTVFNNSISIHTPVKSSSVHQRFIYANFENLLNSYPERQTTAASQTLHEIADKIHKRSLVIIFSDMLENTADSEDLFQSLQHLRHNKHEVLLFHVIDRKKEIDFDFENRPHRFVDMETGEEIKITPSQVKEYYRKSARNYATDLKLRCAQYHIDFIEADINLGFEQILHPYLLKRSRLF